MEEVTNEPVQITPASNELPTPLTGKALLDALFLRTAMNNMSLFNRKRGKHATARMLRGKARTKARKQKRQA